MSSPLTPFENALAGALGGVFSNAIVYPLDTVKTRMQAEKSTDARGQVRKQLGIIETLLAIVRSKAGPKALYRGFATNMLNAFVQQFAYFYWYTIVRGQYVRRVAHAAGDTAALNTATELALGALSAALANCFTTPIGVIATRQQIGSGDNASGEQSFMGHIQEIYEQDGITGFWRGLRPSLVLTVNPAITYGVFERVRTLIVTTSDGKMTPGKSFVVGALSKTLATIVTFPYILSKIRLQAKDTKYKSAFHVLGSVFKEKGVSGWYQGMQAQITKAVLSQALLFYFRDYFEIWTRQILRLVQK